jgi:hypothetical protein
MNSIKNKKQLPKWYCLNNYKCFENLSALEWLEQLTARKLMFDRLLYKDSGDIILKYFLELIEISPLIDTSESLETKLFLRSGVSESILNEDNFSQYALGVHHISVREFFSMQENFDEDKKDYAFKFFDQLKFNELSLDDFSSPLKYEYKDWIDMPIDAIKNSYNDYLTLMVNLKLPDKTLIEQFEFQLKKYRESLAKVGLIIENNKKFSPDSFVKFGLMPFLDLSFWAGMNDTSITNRVFADVLFHDGEGGEEVVRKTTRQLAKDVLEDDFLNKLASLVAKTQSENKR